MTKYNAGDVLEITEDFTQLGADYKSGDKYKVEAVTSLGYNLQPLQAGPSWSAYPQEFDRLETIRKVEFKVGDKVRLLETAHGSPGYSCDTPEKLKNRLVGKGLDYQTVFEVAQEADFDGDVYVLHSEKNAGLYLLPEFLVPWVEEEEEDVEVHELKEPFLQHMELGKTYQSQGNDLYYRPTEFDFEGGKVLFDYSSDPSDLVGRSKREFDFIEDEFGVLPPVKPENEYTTVTAEEFRKEVQEAKAVAHTEVEPEEFASAAPKPETVSVDSLREALDFLGIQEVFDTENIISLAKRLS